MLFLRGIAPTAPVKCLVEIELLRNGGSVVLKCLVILLCVLISPDKAELCPSGLFTIVSSRRRSKDQKNRQRRQEKDYHANDND